MLDVLIGCIWRYIYRPRPRLYKEGGGPNSKYKDMYRYTITTEDTHPDIQDMYLNILYELHALVYSATRIIIYT
jgi:hypothetical protein